MDISKDTEELKDMDHGIAREIARVAKALGCQTHLDIISLLQNHPGMSNIRLSKETKGGVVNVGESLMRLRAVPLVQTKRLAGTKNVQNFSVLTKHAGFVEMIKMILKITGGELEETETTSRPISQQSLHQPCSSVPSRNGSAPSSSSRDLA